jgi:hypothetical protein
MPRSCPICNRDQKNVWTHLARVHGIHGSEQRKWLGVKRKMNQPKEDINHGKYNMVLKHPFTMVISGPTSCGKTSLVSHILQHLQSLIEPPPERIVWLYKRWQPLYDMIEQTVKPVVEFIQGIPPGLEQDTFFDPNVRNLIVLDDLMSVASKDSRITDLFTEGSHHRNLSVLCLNQNLYFSKDPTQRRNSHYIVIFKSPIDKQQIHTLARQMYPGNSEYFMNYFDMATQKPYGYLLVDLKQNTPDNFRLRPNVFQDDSGASDSVGKNSGGDPSILTDISNCSVYNNDQTPIYTIKRGMQAGSGSLEKENFRQVGPTEIIDLTECQEPRSVPEYKRAIHPYSDQLQTKSSSINMHWCSLCGALFKSESDLKHHMLLRCPERLDEDDIRHRKQAKYDSSSDTDSEEASEEDDNSVFQELVQKVSEENEQKFQKQVEIYEGEGMKEDRARSKARELMLPIDRRLFLNKYGRLLEMFAKLKNSPLHHKVTNEIERLMLGEDYSQNEAIKYALKKRKYLFDDLLLDDHDDSEDEDDSDQESDDSEDEDDSDQESDYEEEGQDDDDEVDGV